MGKKTVLFVDDEPAILESVERAMKKDFDVVTASDGSQAWEAIKLFKIDYLVTDVDMPVMSGFDLLEKMRDAGRHITTIVASGGDGRLVERRCNELGVSAYIAKPYAASKLKKMINNMKSYESSGAMGHVQDYSCSG